MSRRRRGYFYGRNPGLERALQHRKEARELSVELGGVDQDVKDYLFSLSNRELIPVLNAYEQRHGAAARAYAEQVLPDWRSGRVMMSGMVASRLFSLLPGFMPIEKKYDLVRSLWEKKCPSSNTAVYVGPDARDEDVQAWVRGRLSEVVREYTIPESITNRFKWLANDDVALQQALYNYFLKMNKEVVALAADERVPVLLRQMRDGSVTFKHITQVIQVGNHQVELVFHPQASGVSSKAPRQNQGSGCLSVLLLLIVVLIAILSQI